MENVSPILKLVENVEGYIKTNVTLYKLTAIKKSADIVSGLVSKMVLLMVITFFVLMLSVGLALWIGEVVESPYKGFLIVSAGYIFIFIILYLFRNPLLKEPARNIVVNEILKGDDDGESL
jgi:hypothetical protein